MEFDNYKAMLATPDKHAELLGQIASAAQRVQDPAELAMHLSLRIKVNGGSYSQVKHLNTLEQESSNWDVENMKPETIDAIVRHSATIKSIDPGFDLPHFTDAFHLLVENMRERQVPIPDSLDASRPTVRPR